MSSQLDTESFQAISNLAYREFGIRLLLEKSSMIQSRLRHRLKELGIRDYQVYAKYVCSEAGKGERRNLVSALTTNVSHFFREKHHFDILKASVLPEALPRLKSGGRFRIWSAGCSNGQEAVSIAMTLLDLEPKAADYDVKILATDIDPLVIAFAEKGVYPERMIGGVPKQCQSRYFETGTSGSEVEYRVKPSVLELIRYKELNLLSKWPMQQEIDVIFCRNVVIYFDSPTQNALWLRFRSALAPNGKLFLGHSERISDPDKMGFFSQGPTTYGVSPTT
jgi:chemotaxis protein methyltransferase CheR